VPLISPDDQGVAITHIAGTIDVDEKDRLKRLLFRATRGKALTFFQDYKQLSKAGRAPQKDKSVYIVVFQEGRQIRERITRICDSFLGQRFEVPPLHMMEQKLAELRRNIQESKLLNKTSRSQLRNYLISINQIQSGGFLGESDVENDRDVPPSLLEVYKWFVAKEKAIYNSMNQMKSGQATYIGYFWCPTAIEEQVRIQLRTYPTTDVQRYENHTIKPPTYLKTNEFSMAFQEIVNTYGVPMYKEINPAVFAIVTFPFLFGVMFGDIGHGFLLLFAGILLVVMDSKIRVGMEAASAVRYLILLMGFFAFFNGFIYNEFFAIPLDLFGSCYSQDVQVLAIDDSNPNKTAPREPNMYGYAR